MKIIPLKYDFCIKEIMENEPVRKYFISDVLEIPLTGIKNKNQVFWTYSLH